MRLVLENDSYRNWIQCRFIYAERNTPDDAFQLRQEVDKKILDWGTQLTSEDLWHVRWGFDKKEPEHFAIRVRPKEGLLKEHTKNMKDLGEDLKTRGLIVDALFDSKWWWTTDDVYPSKCKTIEEWSSLANILQNLSLIVAELLSMAPSTGEFFLYNKVVHHLHNMMHIADSFRPLDVGVQGAFRRAFLMSDRILSVNGEIREMRFPWPYERET